MHMLPLNILGSAMLEVGTATWEPPQLSLLVHPILPPFHFGEVRMVHIAAPDVIPAGGPPDGYLVVDRRGHQAKEPPLRGRAVTLKLFLPRNIQAFDQTSRVIGIVARNVLVVLNRADIDSAGWNRNGFGPIRERDLVREPGLPCNRATTAETSVT